MVGRIQKAAMYLRLVNKRVNNFVKPSFRNFIDFANHTTIFCDAFGQLCDVFKSSEGHFSGEEKSFL